MSKVVIFGTGQNAEVAFFYLKQDSVHEIVAFTVDKAYLKNNMFHQLPVVAFEDLTNHYPPDKFQLFIPISFINNNQTRAEKFKLAKSYGYNCISYISSRTIYYDTPVGENCFILENNVIQPYTKIGDNCTIWSGNHIGHHSIIQDHCFIASHAAIAGSVNIGEYCFIGVNATIRDNINIGRKNIIGAGAIILSDTEENSVYSPGATKRARITSDRLRRI